MNQPPGTSRVPLSSGADPLLDAPFPDPLLDDPLPDDWGADRPLRKDGVTGEVEVSPQEWAAELARLYAEVDGWAEEDARCRWQRRRRPTTTRAEVMRRGSTEAADMGVRHPSNGSSDAASVPRGRRG